MNSNHKTVFAHWIREMVGSDDIAAVVAFVEATNAERLATLEAFALTEREALARDKAKYEARVADRTAAIAAMDGL